MLELMLTKYSSRNSQGTLSLAIDQSSTSRTLSLSLQNVTGTIYFDVSGSVRPISIAALTNITLTVPSGARKIFMKLAFNLSGNGEGLIVTGNNTMIRGVEAWGISDHRIRLSLFGSSNLVSVPLVAPLTTNWIQLLRGCSSFNQDISMWDTNHVLTAASLFAECTAFNKPLNSWNMAAVTNMNGMFNACSNFNQPLNNWSVGNVVTMGSMFYGCAQFNQNLSNLTFPKVTAANRVDYAAGASSWISANRPTFALA